MSIFNLQTYCVCSVKLDIRNKQKQLPHGLFYLF